MVRIEPTSEWLSATKINTYAGSFGCPRKFYNKYIAKLDGKPSIHFPIGNIPHKTFELCFKLKFHTKFESYTDFRNNLLGLHDSIWNEKVHEIEAFNPTPNQLAQFYTESREMIINWMHVYLKEQPKDPLPIVEKTLWDREHKLMCRVDRSMKGSGLGVFHIIDYKTGKSKRMYDDTKLQLIINWVCYSAETGNTRHKVGAHYVRYKEPPIMWTPTQEEIQWALDKAEEVRAKTRSTDINDYPCTCNGRCMDDFIFNQNARSQTIAAEATAQGQR